MIAFAFASMLLGPAGVGRARTVDTTLWAVIDSASGAPRLPYQKVEGAVDAVAPDGSGGWYLGGSISAVRGQPRNNLAHLDAGGNLIAWNSSADARVSVLLVNGGTVYAGGTFTGIGGRARNYLAAIDAASAAATPWDPSPDHAVPVLMMSGSSVLAGGGFTHIGGHYQPCFANISTDHILSVRGNPDVAEGSLSVGPNPTLGSIQIQYAVARATRVRLELLDVSGRIEATLVERVLAPGRHVAAWDGAGRSGPMAPGLYFVRLSAPDQVAVRKIALIR